MPKTYNPAEVILTVAGSDITDFESVKVTFREDAYTDGVATTGRPYRVKNLNRMADVEIVCKQDSATNDTLSALAALDEKDGTGVGAFGLREVNGTTDLKGEECWVKKPADVEYGKEMGDRTWPLVVGKLDGTRGGLT